MNNRIASILVLAAICPLAGCVENRTTTEPRARMGDTKDEARFHQMVDISTEIYKGVTKGSHGEVPAAVLNNARCIAILPNVFTGALVVGGTHGNGLASCKDANNAWSEPAAISLNQGSIGLQAGAKSADLVLFFQSNDAVQALKRGEFALGTEVSAVAGRFDSSLDTSPTGVVVFSRTEGVFAGASINGSKIAKNEEDTASYYGRKVDHLSLLENREAPDNTGYTKKLTKIFPQG